MSESTTASEATAELLRLAVTEAKMHGEDVAPFLIEAVRSLSPEQLAELIGGEVERMVGHARIGAVQYQQHPLGRVVGPWLPVIPVTHQGEETT